MQVIDILRLMPVKNRKDEGIFIRLSAKEKKALQQAADSEERAVADFARQLFRKRLRELGLIPEIDEPKEPRKKNG